VRSGDHDLIVIDPSFPEAQDPEPIKIFTIGHSTHAIGDFVAMLLAHGVEAVVDVRSYPASRRNPQFNQLNLERSLVEAGIEYQHLRELGGRRRPRPDSINMALTNEGFRGYADYMETESFRAGIDRLMRIASVKRTAIMCAEAVWWRCHRSLISDYLKTKGVVVIHILSAKRTAEHSYTAAATIVDDELSYRGLF
jgi:uncharacterized protein (DUF488 family)